LPTPAPAANTQNMGDGSQLTTDPKTGAVAATDSDGNPYIPGSNPNLPKNKTTTQDMGDGSKLTTGPGGVAATNDDGTPYVPGSNPNLPKNKPAPTPAPAPTGMQTVGDDEGNTTITKPDGSSMVVGPDGKQIMPGSNPNLPKNQGLINKGLNWLTNKGQYQKPGGFQPPPGAANPAAAPPQQGAFDYTPTGESRLREDPELTAMLRIAGLR
jgi:hypothetical protein